MSGDTPERKPDSTENTTESAAGKKRETTMPPLCYEYSGGCGSFPDTRDRAEPGHKNGDCDRIGNAPD